MVPALHVLAMLAGSQAPHLVASRTQVAPVIDGRLDDAAWQAATPTDAFTQKFPDSGKPPSERTTVRVLYDDRALYVGFDCEQQRAPLVQRLTRRDRRIESDWVTVGLDTRRDGVSAFEFYVNAAGVLSDALRFNDTDSSTDWDENWEAAAVATDHGWSAELRIPLRALRFSASKDQQWGLQLRRYVSARQETDEWAFIPRDVAGEVSHYGRLEGLDGIQPGFPLEVRPFALGRLDRRDPVTGVIASGTAISGSAGLDLKWHITQDLTLDGTINPDFGQVEADQLILNLTTYETFYPEKRPFFLEGIDTFATPLQVLYTRRIGHVPDIPLLSSNQEIVDLPAPSQIYGAAKVTGQLGPKWHVGALSALTGTNAVQVVETDPSVVPEHPLTVDPVTSFNVLRLRRAISDNGHIGLIATAVNHFETPGTDPVSIAPVMQPCADGSVVALGQRCFHDSFVGGIDGRWRSPSGDYTVSGQVIGSLVEKGPPRQFLDGTVIGSGATGIGGLLYVAKEGGAHWVWDFEYDGASRELDYNDLGYMGRQNLHHLGLDVEYRTLEPWWWRFCRLM